MKYLFGILMLCALNAEANDGRHVTISAAAPLPSTYQVTATSLVASELFSLKHFRLVNYTNSPIACLFVRGEGGNILITNTAPSTPPAGREGKEVFLVASEKYESRDFYPYENVFCRSESSPVVSGDLFFNAW